MNAVTFEEDTAINASSGREASPKPEQLNRYGPCSDMAHSFRQVAHGIGIVHLLRMLRVRLHQHARTREVNRLRSALAPVAAAINTLARAR